MIIIIVKFHQISPANSFPAKLTGLTIHSVELLLKDWIWRLFVYQNIARKLSKLLTYVPSRIGEKEEDFRQHQLSHRINIKFIFSQSTSKSGWCNYGILVHQIADRISWQYPVRLLPSPQCESSWRYQWETWFSAAEFTIYWINKMTC